MALLPSVTGDITRLLALFLDGKKPATLKAYRADLANFADHVGQPSVGDAIKTLLSNGNGEANMLVLGYMQKLHESGIMPATANRRLTALKMLVRIARSIGMIQWALDVKPVKASQKDMSGPGIDGFMKLLEQAAQRQDAVAAARDTAILWLLFGVALRRGEVVGLDLEHVRDDQVFVLGKGREFREAITIPPSVRTAIAAWVKVRPSSIGEDHPLFLALDRGHFGHRLSGSAVHSMVRGYGTLAGLGIVRPHGLRHAAVTHALDVSDGNLRKVQRFSRHRDIKMVQRYDDNRQDLGGDMAKEMDEHIRKGRKT